MIAFRSLLAVWLLSCATCAAWGQSSVLLQSFKNNWIEHDPIREIYQRGMDLIAKQAAIRTAEGLLLRSADWHWDDYRKVWNRSNQLLNTYNLNNQLIGDIGQQWINESWVDQYRTTYVYNESGLVRLFQYEAWTGVNWEIYVRFVHEYDSENRLAVFTAQDWIDNQWVNRYKRIFEYNETFHYVREVRQYWVNGAWENTIRYGDYYDEQGRLKCNMMYDWKTNTWTYASRNLIDYEANANPVQVLRQQHDGTAWRDRSLTTLTYNELDQLTSETYHSLEEDPQHKDTGWSFTYDDHGNLSERTFWSACEPYWQPNSRTAFTYDEANRNTSILHQDYLSYWLNRTYTEYEYSKLTGMTVPDFSDQLILYPNPSSDEVTLTLPSAITGKGLITIVNSMGEIVSTKQIELNTSRSIPIAGLVPGQYVLRLEHDQFIAVKSFSKQ